MGYYSGCEFENVISDLERSYCSSICDVDDRDCFGKAKLIQPYDFGTSRRTKRFFREDYVNLTRAATDKDYALQQYKREMETDFPHLLT